MAVTNQSAAVDISTATTTAVVAAVTGKRIVVYNYTLVNGVATGQSVQFKSGTTALTGVIQLPLAVGGGLAPSSGSELTCLFATARGEALNLVSTAATQFGGSVAYQYA